MPLAGLAVTGTMAGSGMPAVCCALSRLPLPFQRRLPGSPATVMLEIDQFLLVLEVCGLSIALIGCRRERWLARRRR